MKKLSQNIATIFNAEEDNFLMRKALRAAQVRSMWAECVDEIFLEHTNAVYIITEYDQKILIVYVDESIFAAELNAQRELIKLKFLQKFNEDIYEFKIFISRGNYKKNYPFKEEENDLTSSQNPPVPLSKKENQALHEIALKIEDEHVREKFIAAAKADLEWKKGNKL